MAASRGPASSPLKSRACKGSTDVEELIAPRGPPFPAHPGADPAARPRAAGDGHADHRPPWAGICQARQTLPRWHQDHLHDHQSGHHLHRDRHRRVGSRARQHALAGRPRADGGDRAVCHAVEDDGGEARATSGIHQDRLAHRRRDKNKEIKAVCVLHNETSTGCLSPIAEIRKAIDAAGHPALFFVDTISSLASTDYRHDEWGVDVTVGGAQKGLMLPPGMSFNAVSEKAFAAAKNSQLTKSFWAWDDMLAMNKIGFFPYTPATQMLHGLSESIAMLHEEGLENVFARHHRLAEATRRAVRAWGLEIMCRDAKYYSPTVTAVLLPDDHDADAFRHFALDTFNISYGSSFGRYAGKYFRIGHLGDVNEGMLTGALAITEMALALAGIPHKKGGVQAAIDYLIAEQASPARAAAE